MALIMTTFGLFYDEPQKTKSNNFDNLLHVLGSYRSNIRTILQKNAKLIRKVSKEIKTDASDTASLDNDKKFNEFIKDIKTNNENLLKECDILRDQHLLNMGILIDDRPNNEFVVKVLDANQLQQEKEKRECDLNKKKDTDQKK